MPHLRYYAVAQKLHTLPPELIHKILNDLPIIKILETASVHNTHYIDDCVISHIDLCKIFPTAESFSTCKAYFTLYTDLCHRRQCRGFDGNPDIPSLKVDVLSFVNHFPTEIAADKITAIIMAELSLHLDAYQPYLLALAKYAPNPSLAVRIPGLSNPVMLRDFLDNIFAAEARLNRAKSLQLQRIARLHLEYPGMLKDRLDTFEDSRNISKRHRIDNLERLARKMAKSQILRGRFIAKTIFAEQRFPVTPYNHHLKHLLDILEKFPLGKSTPPRFIETQVYPLPTHVLKDIQTVIEGMAYVYPKQSVNNDKYLPILRTKYTPYSDSAFRASTATRSPKFLGGADDEDPLKHMHFLDDNDNILPLEEREFDWLEAFLRTCQYMERRG